MLLSTSRVAAMAATTLLCFLLPALLWIYAAKRERKLALAVLFGALGFVVPQFLIRLPILSALGMSPGVQAFAQQNTVLYGFLLAFTAGLFETAGRVFVFGVLLRKRRSYYTGFAAGVGHGGIEAIGLVGVTYISYLIINAAVGAGALPDTGTVREVLDALAAMPPATFLAAGAERAFTIALHMALSLMVCYFAARGQMLRGALYALAVHTLVDFFAVTASAAGWNIWLIEGMIALVAVLSVLFIVWVRARFPVPAAPEETEPPQPES